MNPARPAVLPACAHRRCTTACWIAFAATAAAFAALTWVLFAPSVPAVIALLAMVAAAFAAAVWPCPKPSEDDLMALADATREDPVYVPSYFPAEWIKEHGR